MIYGWKQGLKTGVYYVRTKAATNAIKFTVDMNVIKNVEEIKNVYQAIANYLQLPVGAGEMQYYDFDLIDFSKKDFII